MATYRVCRIGMRPLRLGALFALAAPFGGLTTGYAGEMTELKNRAERAVAAFTSDWAGHAIVARKFLQKEKDNNKILEKLFATYPEFHGKCPAKFQSDNDSRSNGDAEILYEKFSDVYKSEAATFENDNNTVNSINAQDAPDELRAAARKFIDSRKRVGMLKAFYPVVSNYHDIMALLFRDNCIVRAILSVEHSDEAKTMIPELEQNLTLNDAMQREFINGNGSKMSETIDTIVSIGQ